MTEFTKVHKFSIPIKFYNHFMRYYANAFDKTGHLYWLYDECKDVEFVQGIKHMVIYIETVNNEEMLNEIEKLKSKLMSSNWYSQMKVTRLYQLPLIKEGIRGILRTNCDFKKFGDESYITKYVYYRANAYANSTGFGVNIPNLCFLTSSDEFMDIEDVQKLKKPQEFCDTNSFICMKVTFVKERNDRIVSSKIHCIYFSN